MSEALGDLRGRPEASVALAQKSLRTLGYVVVSDSDPVGLDPRFRSDVLPEYARSLEEDPYGIPPIGRLRADGLLRYARREDGSVQLTHEYDRVPTPTWSGNGHVEPRVYPNRLPVMEHPVARLWVEGFLTLTAHELPSPGGFMRLQYFETGHSAGKVVERRHKDGELFVGSSPDFINGGGAETTLSRQVNGLDGFGEPTFEEVATFRLDVGHTALSNDVALWHYATPLTPPSDGSEPRRRSFIPAILTPRTNAWLEEVLR